LGGPLSSPILSTTDAGFVSFFAVFEPDVSSESSRSEMMSADTESTGSTSKGLAENETNPHARTRA
jgi:hypothetical protein